MRVGITGANGFIGNHLTRYLNSLGHETIAFLQRGTSESTLQGQASQIYWGDITRPETLTPFLKHCDTVFHLAGLNTYWTRNPGIFHEVNYDGTRNVAEACLAHGIKKLVHVSSCITLGASGDPVARNENAEFNLDGCRFLYAETKKAGEDVIKGMIRDKGLPAVIVNPTSAIGEMDFGPTPIGKPIADICRGMWPAYVAGGACFIDVHDVVRGLWLAMEKGRIGEQYLLAGDNLSNKEFMTKVALLAGKKRPKVRVPRPVLKTVAHLGEWYADNVSYRHPPLTVGMTSVIGKFLYFDGSKARDHLGFEAQPCDGAIQRCIEWFRETGRL